MHRAPLDGGQGRPAIYGVAEHVEHPREDRLADRGVQRPAGVEDRHSTREPLGGRQGDPAHVAFVLLGEDLDDDLIVRSGAEHRIDGRKGPVETDIHNTPPNSDNHTCRRIVSGFGVSHWSHLETRRAQARRFGDARTRLVCFHARRAGADHARLAPRRRRRGCARILITMAVHSFALAASR
ncbi:hypothetical protein GALL_502620 [mine drainage metagenome]|uniref:Uncharacterized protein n=1 Tax=mine drainage metagenome TaxID=410659 RepID=A0A1J5PX01_9ZZZZ